MPQSTALPADTSPRTISGRVEARLRDDILRGVILPGSRLNLDRLRGDLGVGLSPLREAVTRLVSDGLVEVSPQRGYRIAPISVENLDEVCALRMEIEPFALRRAIANGGIEWEAAVTAALHRLNRTSRIPGHADSLAAWEAANNAFHLALIERCDMPLLLGIHRSLVNLNDRYRHLYLKAAPMQRDVIEEHTAIAEAAIARRADDAADLLAGHIRRSGENLRRLIADDLPSGET